MNNASLQTSTARLWFDYHAKITDEDRKNILILDCPDPRNMCYDWPALITKQGKDSILYGGPTYMDQLLKLAKNELPSDIDKPFIYDLRLGRTRVAISYVNAGANDFNSAYDDKTREPTEVACPSIMLASLFKLHKASFDNLDKQFPQLKIQSREAVDQVLATGERGTARTDFPLLQNLLDDYIYMYKAITHPKGLGLNHKWIEAYDAKFPEEQIKETMKQMSVYANMPQERRPWHRQEPEQVQEKKATKRNWITEAWKYIIGNLNIYS